MARRAFGDACSRVGGQNFFVVDRRDIHIDGAQVLVRATTRAGVAIVVDDNRDGVGVIPERVGRLVQVENVAGVVEVGVQVRQRPFQRQRVRQVSGDRNAGCSSTREISSRGGREGNSD